MDNASRLSDGMAIQALCDVVRRWSTHRGFEALLIATRTRELAAVPISQAPSWAVATPETSPAAGAFARKMLEVLTTGEDDEVAIWAQTAVRTALDKQAATVAHVLDPISISIAGGILIGAILAARVKRIGPVEFYEGVPKELADVVKIGASVSTPNA